MEGKTIQRDVKAIQVSLQLICKRGDGRQIPRLQVYWTKTCDQGSMVMMKFINEIYWMS